MTGFRLIPLDCPKCGAALAAEGEDVVYYCTACRSGHLLTPGDGDALRLEQVEVAFVAVPGQQVERHLPFWLLPAQVTLHQRDATGGALAFLAGLFGSGSPGPGTTEGTFAIPAFHAELPAATELAARYTRELPRLGERLGEKLTGGRYGVEDARKLAHYLLIATEAGRSDTLKDLEYKIDFGAPRLLGVPFVRRGEGLVDACFGLGA